MSITLLLEQNVSRYFARNERTLTIVYKGSSVFQFCVSHFISSFFFINGLSPALFLISIFDDLFEKTKA